MYCLLSYRFRKFSLSVTGSLWVDKLRWLENAYARPIFSVGIVTSKVGQADLVFGL